MEALDDERAGELARELARRKQHGGDERELRDVVANTLRLKKRDAQEVVARFEHGYHAGINDALGDDRRRGAVGVDPLWEHAFASGRDLTDRIRVRLRRDRLRARAAPAGPWFPVAACVLAVVRIVLWD